MTSATGFAASTGPIDASTAFDTPEPPGSRLRMVWTWQLLFAAVVAIIVVVGHLLDPAMLAIPPLVIGVTGVFATSVAALVVPWERLPEPAVTVLPYLDIVWVGLLTFSTELRLSHLWVFPVTWLASRFSLPRLVGGLAAVGLITLVEVLVNETSRASALRVLIAVLALAFVGIAVYATARQSRAFRTLLVRQSDRIHHSLDTVAMERARVSDTLDAVHIAIARVDGSGELLSANAAYRELYAIDSADPGQPARSVEYDGLRGTAVRSADRTFARATRGERLDDERVWLFDPSGGWHALAVTTRPQSARGGEEPSTVVIAEDVTELISADKRRDALAAVVSHELRNPLTAILGHTDRLLENEKVDDRMLKDLRVIEESSERMMHLVDAILSSPPESTTRADRDARSATELGAIIEASLESFALSATQRSITLVHDGADPLPLWADAFRLRTLLDNLVGNALKYTPPRGRVEIAARRSGAHVVVTVRDTGIGISPSDLDRVFDPYFRSATAVESRIPGSGLGLGIVRTIVDAHGGTIGIESEPGVGTTVTVSLPAEAT